MARSLYVYALVHPSVRLPRLAGHRMEVVDVGGIGAAVERRNKAPQITEQALRDQYRVVMRLHEATDAILPVRFGALVPPDELTRIVALRRRVLLAALRNVRGKSQMTVRLIGPSEAQAGTPVATAAAIAASGTDYLISRSRSSRPEMTPLGDAVRAAVRSLVSAETVDRGRGAIQLTINHLVPRGRVARYRSRVETAAAGLGSTSRALVSGPLPPFAFAPDLWE